MSAIPLNALISTLNAMHRARRVMVKHIAIPYEEIIALDGAIVDLNRRIEEITKAIKVEVAEVPHAANA